jgi:phosphoribosyl-ATP pyrophosphohydrolase
MLARAQVASFFVAHHGLGEMAECGVRPESVFGEIDRRERIYGIAEKLPKQVSSAQSRRLTLIQGRRLPEAKN